MRANKGSTPYHHVDSFTEVWFAGNPPEVFLGSDFPADEIMRRFAAETNIMKGRASLCPNGDSRSAMGYAAG